jgi:hypothetical protein
MSLSNKTAMTDTATNAMIKLAIIMAEALHRAVVNLGGDEADTMVAATYLVENLITNLAKKGHEQQCVDNLHRALTVAVSGELPVSVTQPSTEALQ